QGEGNHVRRPVMVEEPLVEAGNGGIVQEGQAHLRFLDPLPREHSPGALFQAGILERDQLLRAGDRHTDHSFSSSATTSTGSGSSPRGVRAADTCRIRNVRVAMWSSRSLRSTVNGPLSATRIRRQK